jgi:hypothetical protein
MRAFQMVARVTTSSASSDILVAVRFSVGLGDGFEEQVFFRLRSRCFPANAR